MKDEEDIKVNKRKADKVYFESVFIQSLSDKIDFLKDESKEILKELDSTEFKQQLDEIDLEEFSEDAINQIDDLFDDISKFKDDVLKSDDISEDLKEQYRNTQAYFNRDEDYLRRAKRKMARLEDDKLADVYKTNNRVVELCDKAISVRCDNFDAYVLKAQALINLERYDDAIEEFINALAIKDDVEVWLEIANANRLNGDFDDALNVYDRVLSTDCDSSQAFKGKAYVYYDLSDYKKADQFFKKANSIEYLDEESMRIWGESLEKLA